MKTTKIQGENQVKIYEYQTKFNELSIIDNMIEAIEDRLNGYTLQTDQQTSVTIEWEDTKDIQGDGFKVNAIEYLKTIRDQIEIDMNYYQREVKNLIPKAGYSFTLIY